MTREEYKRTYLKGFKNKTSEEIKEHMTEYFRRYVCVKRSAVVDVNVLVDSPYAEILADLDNPLPF